MTRESIPVGSRRTYLKGVAAGAAAGLAGCLGGGGDSEEGISDPIEVYTWNLPFWEETITGEIIPTFEDEFGDEYDGLEGDSIDRGPKTEDIISFFQSRLQSGNPPSVFDTQFGAYARYAEEGVFADIEELADDELLEQYDDTALELNQYDGTLYQLPFYMGTNMTACRTQWFDEAGIDPPTFEEPWSTHEYLDAAEELVENSGAEFGLTFIRFDYLLWPWFKSEGVDVLTDDNSEAAFNTSTTVELLERFRQLTDDGVLPEVTWTGEWQPAAEQFGAGDTGIYFGSGSALRLIQNMGEDWVSEDTIDIAHAPADGGLFTFHGLGITTPGKSDTEQQAALDLASVILNKEFQQDFLRNTTVLVPHTEAMEELQADDEFQSNNPLLVQLYDMYDVVAEDLWRPPVIPKATEIADIIDTEFSAAALGEKDPQDAVDEAESRVNSTL
ncbi:extracellular solute-binding protein [Halosolutus gelatinilyticus]|uniref:extracellular solute-binding protein n=1 Tax=Halosolutus gelatinilyticus TaxID=2931975 RepID=UPI001FF68161|nr:extracellular solute-binding protein [Halosolutus gelatinilyticus]